MKNIHSLLLAAALSLPAFAFADHDGGASCKRPNSAKQFKEIDTDNDGTVDKAEFRAMHDKMFDAMDGDHDGTLTQDEMKAGKHNMMKDKMKGH